MDSKTELKPVRARRQRRKTLTDAMVAALPRRPGRTYYFTDPEMPKHGVRVRPVGPHTFTVIARNPHGRQRWARIGLTSEMAVAEAREKAREVIRRIEAGLEPFEAPKARPDSVEDVAANWLARHVERNALRTADELRRIVTKYILPHIGKLDFIDLRRKRIAELLDLVEDAHGRRQADTVLSVLRSMATFVQARDEDYVSPFTRGMRRVPKGERTRSRKLDDDELRAVWAHAESAGDFGAFVRLLLLTAQRFDKVLDIRWTDLDSEGVWTIRTSRGEKGNIGKVRLPDAALQIIAAQPRFDTNPHVFAGSRGRRRVFGSFNKRAFDQGCDVAGWTLHDLRRTARSLMSRAGVRPDIAERVLGHAIRGIEGIYDRHQYEHEKADALRALAALIERIVNPPADNVVPLHGAVPS
jgi:integrase